MEWSMWALAEGASRGSVARLWRRCTEVAIALWLYRRSVGSEGLRAASVFLGVYQGFTVVRYVSSSHV